jgi:hypothetical protein
MNKQTEHFLKALQDIEQGKVVPLDKALNEEPPSKELQKVFDSIESIDAEREAWKRMFDLQTKLVMGLEMDKIRLEKLIELNMKDLHDIADQRDWYYEEYRKLKDRLNVA